MDGYYGNEDTDKANMHIDNVMRVYDPMGYLYKSVANVMVFHQYSKDQLGHERNENDRWLIQSSPRHTDMIICHLVTFCGDVKAWTRLVFASLIT